MLKNQNGFGFFGIVLCLLIAAVIGLTGYTVYSRTRSTSKTETGNKNNQAANPENLYKGKINTWLSGATDDNFINYYKLDYELPELLVGCAADITADVNELTNYSERKLTVNIVAKVEKIEQTDGPVCQALPSPHQGSVDLNKDWLTQDGELELIVNGREHVLTVDKKNYTFFLDPSNVMPFYPDKIGVLKAALCAGYTRNELLGFASDNKLSLADNKYPGLSKLYRDPEEVHVVFDDAARAVYKQPYDRCSPHILKPVLIKRLDTQD